MVPKLKLERIRYGVRQYQLAAALGVPQTTVCAWENGRRPMTPEQERSALTALRVLVKVSRVDGESDRAPR
jgi:DNA-binding transcriptional regulator YiaG